MVNMLSVWFVVGGCVVNMYMYKHVISKDQLTQHVNSNSP